MGSLGVVWGSSGGHRGVVGGSLGGHRGSSGGLIQVGWFRGDQKQFSSVHSPFFPPKKVEK